MESLIYGRELMVKISYFIWYLYLEFPDFTLQTQFLPHETIAVFDGKIEPNDIKQGELGA